MQKKNVCLFLLLESPGLLYPSPGPWTPFFSSGTQDFSSTCLGINSLSTTSAEPLLSIKIRTIPGMAKHQDKRTWNHHITLWNRDSYLPWTTCHLSCYMTEPESSSCCSHCVCFSVRVAQLMLQHGANSQPGYICSSSGQYFSSLKFASLTTKIGKLDQLCVHGLFAQLCNPSGQLQQICKEIHDVFSQFVIVIHVLINSHFHCIVINDLIQVIPGRTSGFPYFLQFKPEFCNKEFMI